MASLTKEQIAAVKAKGFLRNCGTECFSGRLVPAGCVFSAADLKAVAELAERFGSGKVAFTTRLTAEIVGIPFEQIDNAIGFAAEHNLYFGGTGAKIRPVTACKGTTCVFGNCDTQGLVKKLHEEYYLGWQTVTLPQKFKIAVGGCRNRGETGNQRCLHYLRCLYRKMSLPCGGVGITCSVSHFHRRYLGQNHPNGNAVVPYGDGGGNFPAVGKNAELVPRKQSGKRTVGFHD